MADSRQNSTAWSYPKAMANCGKWPKEVTEAWEETTLFSLANNKKSTICEHSKPIMTKSLCLTSAHPPIQLFWADFDWNFLGQNFPWSVLVLWDAKEISANNLWFTHLSWSSLLVLWLGECQEQIKFIWDLFFSQRSWLCFQTIFTSIT